MPSGTDIWAVFCGVAAERPEHPAIIYGDQRLSFKTLQFQACGFAERLQNDGLLPGQRCVICAINTPDMAVAILGSIAAGLIPSIVNAQAPKSHVFHAIETTEANALVISDDMTRSVPNVHFYPLDEVSQAQQSTEAFSAHRPVSTDPASIVFTSGSTGRPKGVTQSHSNLIWGATEVGRALGLRSDDRILGVVPWAFDYGWGQLLSTFLLGITQVLPAKKGPFDLCTAIDHHKPTVLPGVPSLFAELLGGMSPIRATDVSSIRLITNTGSKIPSGVFQQMLDIFPDAKISLNYGLTETYRSATLPCHLSQSKSKSVGTSLPGAKLLVLREDGALAEPGEKGEVVHTGAGVFLGYWGDPDKTAEVRRPDPFATKALPTAHAVFTGDIGWKDEDGHLHIDGRKDRQIKSMGVRVSPDEIEELIRHTGLVRDVAIIGLEHEIVGQQIAAVFVAASDDLQTILRGLKRSARETMSPFMRPMIWSSVPELPRNPNGKVDYPAIQNILQREMAA